MVHAGDAAIEWRHDQIICIDQTVLPYAERRLSITTVDELIDAIVRLAIRGAPMLGAAGALGVVLAAVQGERSGWSSERLRTEIDRIRWARPTAVNLEWGVEEVLPALRRGIAAAETAAVTTVARIAAANREIGDRGAAHLTALCDGRLRVHTHCNTGALACVEWGTALGVIRTLHERGRLANVIVDETRPLLQGSRLTCWELARAGIAHQLVPDGAGPFVLAQGLVDAVVVGADRIAANGDVANKIGTYGLALAAHRARIPFLVAAPESTIDPATPTGASIPVERRSEAEVTHVAGRRVAPEGTRAVNFAFDITPAELITAIVTERRVIAGEPPVRGSTATAEPGAARS
ncbi:S-methyl-5-thioribose-1-phosphate isomerase [Actinoallomurus sp. CA-150999]|uniref:S-methyl-5-thioribose-1-phosphate isomerase n=1 Tax=Actinoallomurus sp. CA-150999 TaxID=3239887 RepID=UPI003D914FBC